MVRWAECDDLVERPLKCGNPTSQTCEVCGDPCCGRHSRTVWGMLKCFYCCGRVTQAQMEQHPERYPGEWHREPLVFEDVHLTPQVAGEWLSWVWSREGSNTRIRVEEFAQTLREDRWEHQTLAHPLGITSRFLFSPDGYLLTGIQRLEAVLMASRPMDVVIARPYTEDDKSVYRPYEVGTGEPILPVMELPVEAKMRDIDASTDDGTEDPMYVALYQAVMEAIAPSYAVREAVTPPTYRWLHKQAVRRAKWIAGKYTNEAQTHGHDRD